METPLDDDLLRDLFVSLPEVSIRRLFGGKGIYSDGLIVAIVMRGELLLKADDETIPEFRAAGCTQWIYANRKSGRPVAMPYWTLPDGAIDDPDDMQRWALLAFEAARRAPR